MYIYMCVDTGYCCRNEEGCNFFTETEPFCAASRDSTIPLCGACVDGYSELLVGTSCALSVQSEFLWFICGMLYVYPHTLSGRALAIDGGCGLFQSF